MEEQKKINNITFFTAWKRWKDFKGRSCRKEYWLYLLSLLILNTLFFVILMILGVEDNLANFLLSLTGVVLFPVTCCLTMRRLHDIGLNGRWIILFYICPFILTLASNWITFFYEEDMLLELLFLSLLFLPTSLLLGFCDSQSGDNKYGANPKGVSGESRNMLQKIKSWPLPRVIGCTVGVVLLSGVLFGISFRAYAWFKAKAPQMEFELGCYYYQESKDASKKIENKKRNKIKAKAIKCWRKAAEQGHSEAQFLLGCCHYHGYGVDKDAAEAEKWWRKAAEQNHSEAQFLLGCCYFAGYGIARDVGEAEKWWSKAAEQNHAYAEEALKELPQKQHLSMQKQEKWALGLLWFRLAGF